MTWHNIKCDGSVKKIKIEGVGVQSV